MNQQVTDYIEKAPDEQKQIMNSIRKLIHESVDNVTEEFKWNRPVFNAGKDFAYLKTAKNHVTLGFFNFEKIIDADNLLEGTGKDMRHVKLKSIDDINQELFKSWFKATAGTGNKS